MSSTDRINISGNTGDVTGVGVSGSGNIIGKDIKGNIFYFNINNITTEQLKNIVTSSTALDTSLSNNGADSKNIENQNKVKETKQHTSQVLEDI